MAGQRVDSGSDVTQDGGVAISVESRGGRLIEVRMESPVTLEEIEGMVQQVRLRVIACPEPIVLCALLDRLSFLSTETESPLLDMLKRDNPRLQRAGYLMSRQYSPLRMQIERLVRSAQNPNRQVFDDPGLLRGFLGEILRPDERARLDQFLQEHTQKAPASSRG